MNNTKRISFVIPVFNAENYLEEAVHSLQLQTYPNIEIILVNDGSVDNSLALCEKLAKKDERIVVMNQANQGPGAARNTGMAHASGDYLAFLDADDWLDPEMCQKCIKVAEITKADITLFSYVEEFIDTAREVSCIELKPAEKEKEYVDVTQLKDDLQAVVLGHVYSKQETLKITGTGFVANKFYRRDFVGANKLQFVAELLRSEDTVFACYALQYAKKIVYLDQHLYHYRRHDASISAGTRYIPDCLTSLTMLLYEFQKFIVTFSKPAIFDEALRLRTLKVLFESLSYDYFNPQNPKSKRQIKEEIKQIIGTDPYKTALNNKADKLTSITYRIMKPLLQRNMIYTYWQFHKIILKSRQKNLYKN